MMMLAIALVLGTALRFYRLGAEEMSTGEALAWTAADAPKVIDVIKTGLRLDSGKLALYDIAEHYWIMLFGDQIGALRMLSAALGSLTIIFLFVSMREMLGVLDQFAPDEAELVAALGALLFACNLALLKQDRNARMYALMLLLVVAQIWFFIRAHRRPGALNFIVAALLTTLAIASNFTASLVFAAESAWLGYVLWSGLEGISIVRPAMALGLGALFFAPLWFAVSGLEVGAFHTGAVIWVERQPPWWPLSALKGMSGNSSFGPFLALAIFGTWWQWRRARTAVRFILCWLVLPFAMILVISYAITPFMVERYVLSSFIAFLALVALGLASIRNRLLRYALLAVVLEQSGVHIYHYWHAPQDIQWREAGEFAEAIVPKGKSIAVMPGGETLYVLHYYLRDRGMDIIGASATIGQKSRIKSFSCGPEPIAIVQLDLPEQSLKGIRSCYPRTLKKLRHIEVVSQQ
jgi:hypothetical protein